MDRKAIIAIVLCVALMLGWEPLLRQFGFVTAPPASEAPAAVAEPAPPATATPAPAPEPAVAEPVAVVVPATAPEAAAPTAPVATLAVPSVWHAELDARSGAISDIVLEQYRNDARTEAMRLGVDGQAVGDLLVDGKPLLTPLPRLVEQTPERLVLERDVAGGAQLRQEWAAVPGRPYEWQYTVRLLNRGATPLSLQPLAVLGGRVALPADQAKGGLGMPADLAANVSFAGETRSTLFNPKEIGKLDAEETAKLASRPVKWVAAHSKYFILAMSAKDAPAAGVRLASEALGGEADTQAVSAWLLLPASTLPPGGELARAFRVYAGPKDLTRLTEFGEGLDSVLQMDLFFFFHPAWMGTVSKLILQAMLWVHAQLGTPWAYGVAIILITLLVKMLFWPLTHYSTLSMKKMQALQPLMSGIKEKYKEDKALQQQKIMELYREHQVNPLGGCLPMLLQIPVFFALFNVFRGAIELRHAPFLWVNDLSQPDTLPFLANLVPIRPLAILTGVTMFIQQRVTPTSMDPTQAKMMTFMTIFFAFIFYSMPSGLTLYWTVNQALGIAQTLITFRLVQQMAPATVAKSPAK